MPCLVVETASRLLSIRFLLHGNVTDNVLCGLIIFFLLLSQTFGSDQVIGCFFLFYTNSNSPVSITISSYQSFTLLRYAPRIVLLSSQSTKMQRYFTFKCAYPPSVTEARHDNDVPLTSDLKPAARVFE